MSVFDDFERIKKAGLPPILVISGESEPMIQELKKQLLEFVHFDATDLSQSYFDLNATNSDLALEELESLPFFSDSRFVIFENLLNLSTAKKSVFDESQMQRFEKYVEQPVDFTRLAVIVHGKLDSRLKVVKKLKKQAILLEATDLKKMELVKYLAGVYPEIGRPLILRIVEKSNEQFAVAVQNIELVKTYAGERAITEADIEKVVPKSLQDNIFLLTELVIQGKIAQARDLVHDLVLQGEEIIKLTAILTNSFRLYAQVKVMQDKKWNENKQNETLKIHPYRVKLANQQVRKISKTYLFSALLSLIDLDFQLKSSGGDPTYLFDITLIKLTLKK